MTRINLFRNAPSTLNSVAWGKINHPTTSALIFAALLLACSFTVGCSSDQVKNEQTKNNQSAVNQPIPVSSALPITPIPTTASVEQAAAKPVHKKTVRKVPPVVTYSNPSSGVSFDYPRKYALKTGDAASKLISTGTVPMDFIQPGGVSVAAVALPDSTLANSDVASAFFDVSMHKSLTADQCGEFSVPQPNPAAPSDPSVQATAQLATPPISKLLIGDLELDTRETNSDAPREEAARYYHVYRNNLCYEFALKVATTKPEATTAKPTPTQVDREQVFQRLEKILATVKINPVPTAEVDAEVKTPPQAETPAQ
jgi:hypothetical protein